MNNDFDSLYILAQNLEGTSGRIAKVRQYLLDHQMFEQWIELVEADGALTSAIEAVAELMRQDQQLIVGDKGDLNT